MNGQTFGKYTLVDRLAVGGMAEIFLARMEGLEGFEKPTVIKRIRPHLSSQQQFVKMFLNEAKLAAQLNHPAIVQIYELGKVGDSYFIAMEYVSGRDMSRVLPKCRKRNIPFPLEYALKIASTVLEGLYYAHNKADHFGVPLGVVHRDITPENIFVSFDGTVKILDFGIAKAAGGVESETKVGEIKGKLSYLSPEQCRGETLDGRSDIFSLGVVIYEWLTGYKLFTGDNEVAVISNIVEGKIYPPSYFKPDIPPAVEKLVMRALEKDRNTRWQTAWEFQAAIDEFLTNHEFTPSNTHLANFMKQLFADEIERDKDRLRRLLEAPRVETPPPPDVRPPPPRVGASTPGSREISAPGYNHDGASGESGVIRPQHDPATGVQSSGGKLLKIAIRNEEFEQLREMARKHQVKVTDLVKEILRGYIRFQ